MEVQQDQHPMANAFQLDDTVQLVGLVKAELHGAQGTICEPTLPGSRIMMKLEDCFALLCIALLCIACIIALHCFALLCFALLCIALWALLCMS